MRQRESIPQGTDICPTDFIGETCNPGAYILVAFLALKLPARACLTEFIGETSFPKCLLRIKDQGRLLWVELDWRNDLTPNEISGTVNDLLCRLDYHAEISIIMSSIIKKTLKFAVCGFRICTIRTKPGPPGPISPVCVWPDVSLPPGSCLQSSRPENRCSEAPTLNAPLGMKYSTIC